MRLCDPYANIEVRKMLFQTILSLFVESLVFFAVFLKSYSPWWAKTTIFESWLQFPLQNQGCWNPKNTSKTTMFDLEIHLSLPEMNQGQGGNGPFSPPCPEDGGSPSFPSQITRAATWNVERLGSWWISWGCWEGFNHPQKGLNGI